ncbi:hypothetical protein [Photobacterium kishitanii]|uniref:hypothetical protein n=1 Tax=Photobacterium kishitanii TaxID=318456 RepID=UPI000D152B85|nr:hypothetical protein [Photobacterium kishitanii]PSU23854.1 hypothetical protein CTM84_02800 [Photobacterium kishitanii]
MSNSKAIYERISLILLQLLEENFITQTLESLEENSSDDKLTEFETIIQSIEDLCNEMMSHQVEVTIFSKMNELKNNIISIKEISEEIEFPVDISNLIILIGFAEYILRIIEDINLDLVEVNFDDFGVIENISEDLNVDSFFYHDLTNLHKSILFFRGSSSLDSLIDSGLTPTLAMIIISLLPEKEDLASKSFLIINNALDVNSRIQALSLLKLFIVCSGKKFHTVRELPHRNLQHYIDRIDHQLNYQQFNESLIILSEYNSRKELLNKYISLYHIVENFMFKYPLVKLNREKGGDMFSIRDFKDMYKKVDSSEPISLETFLDVALKQEINGQSLLDITHSAFLGLTTTTTMTETNINDVFATLNIGTKTGCYKYTNLIKPQSKQNFHQVIAKLVYVIRNSIVHNKETEFHLSHETLNDNICTFIEKFLVPQMEDILFSLLIVRNDVVWYEHQNIKLFA